MSLIHTADIHIQTNVEKEETIFFDAVAILLSHESAVNVCKTSLGRPNRGVVNENKLARVRIL